MAPVIADRPGVAIAIGGSGLVADPLRGGVAGGRDLREDRGQIPGGARLQHPGTGTHGGGVLQLPQVERFTATGDGAVDPHQVEQAQAQTAQPDGQSRRGRVGQHRSRPGAAHPGEQARRPHRVQELHRRDVE